MAGVTSPDVVVVGAGFAGLSAAVRLARNGARVLVVEARSRLGGRATAFPDRETGEIVDNGQHILLGCYTETFAFLGEIGATELVRLDTRLAVPMIDRAGRRTVLSCPSLPAPFHLLAGIADWDALTAVDKWSALGMVTPIRNARRELRGGSTAKAASPGETIDAWLIRNGQTARIREMLWHPLALAALNQPANRAAAPPFARVLAEMFGGDARDAAIAWPLRPLHLTYAEPAREYLNQHRSAVRHAVSARVKVADGRIAAVEAAGERWAPGAVVVAVPWFGLPDVFEESPRELSGMLDAARRTVPCPIVTVNLWLDRSILHDAFVGLPGRAMQWVFDKGPHLSMVSSGADAMLHQSNDALVALAVRDLFEAIPEGRAARITRASVVREPRATFSLAPGQPARPSCETAVKGLFLAGDWIDTGLPATIESAVRSGHRAAALAS